MSAVETLERGLHPGEATIGREGARPLLFALGSFLPFMAVCYYCAVELGWGEAESAHDPSSIWMYVRRCSMVGLAALLPVLASHEGWRSYGWSISRRWLWITLAVGLFCGYGNSRGGGGYNLGNYGAVDALLLVAGAAFHAFSTEVYFRAYWIRVLERYTRNAFVPILGSSLLYAVSYMTVFASWHSEKLPLWGFFLLFTGLGLLFGWGYSKSRSVYVAWGMHFLGVLNFWSYFRN